MILLYINFCIQDKGIAGYLKTTSLLLFSDCHLVCDHFIEKSLKHR
jgi:hypothetical protein